jgi:hypothetical protein
MTSTAIVHQSHFGKEALQAGGCSGVVIRDDWRREEAGEYPSV